MCVFDSTLTPAHALLCCCAGPAGAGRAMIAVRLDAQQQRHVMLPSVPARGASIGTTLSGDQRLDLPCGIYYLDYINVSGNVTLAAHGNTALLPIAGSPS